jgi:hypothetical protein
MNLTPASRSATPQRRLCFASLRVGAALAVTLVACALLSPRASASVLFASASPTPSADGPVSHPVPETGRTLVLLGIGVVAAAWAHRKTTLERIHGTPGAPLAPQTVRQERPMTPTVRE